MYKLTIHFMLISILLKILRQLLNYLKSKSFYMLFLKINTLYVESM